MLMAEAQTWNLEARPLRHGARVVALAQFLFSLEIRRPLHVLLRPIEPLDTTNW
jgi:hypothetical protein